MTAGKIAATHGQDRQADRQPQVDRQEHKLQADRLPKDIQTDCRQTARLWTYRQTDMQADKVGRQTDMQTDAIGRQTCQR